jgi:hypothetical protein
MSGLSILQAHLAGPCVVLRWASRGPPRGVERWKGSFGTISAGLLALAPLAGLTVLFVHVVKRRRESGCFRDDLIAQAFQMDDLPEDAHPGSGNSGDKNRRPKNASRSEIPQQQRDEGPAKDHMGMSNARFQSATGAELHIVSNPFAAILAENHRLPPVLYAKRACCGWSEVDASTVV